MAQGGGNKAINGELEMLKPLHSAAEHSRLSTLGADRGFCWTGMLYYKLMRKHGL